MDPDISACASTSMDDDPFAWWEATFTRTYLVKRVSILPNNSWAASDIGGSKVFIGDIECGWLSDYINDGEWIDIYCGYEGIPGDSVRVQRTT